MCPEQTKCVEGQFCTYSRQAPYLKPMWYVYILLCKDGSLYTGSSNNPQKRFLHHKEGKGGKYTRSHKPIKLLYTEQHPDKSSALKRELQIKGWSRKKKIEILKLKV
jgi:putative endonuclease